jgi:hypothetical protein
MTGRARRFVQQGEWLVLISAVFFPLREQKRYGVSYERKIFLPKKERHFENNFD